ncbi:MAG: DeoR/GlpR family DNA-binding transcription regulator [Oscillospiraceae bacterium]
MERTAKLLTLLSTHKLLSIQRMCDELFCSPSSLRRDLIELEKTGAVRRVRGGAMYVAGRAHDYSFNFRENENVMEIEYISGIVKDFLGNGMSLFLDSSSTVSKVCPVLECLINIKVVTNGIATALVLNDCEHIDAFITGGHLQKGNATLLGEPSGDYIDNFRADLAIISCCGIDESGAFEVDPEQARIKQHMIVNAKKTILLADHTKFGNSFFHRLCSFDALQAVITDTQPSRKIVNAIQSTDCEILY